MSENIPDNEQQNPMLETNYGNKRYLTVCTRVCTVRLSYYEYILFKHNSDYKTFFEFLVF